MTWQPLRTHDKSTDMVLVALIRNGQVLRVSEARHDGHGYYNTGGYACHWATHFMPLPKVGYTPEQPPAASDSQGNDLLVIVNPHEFRCPHCSQPIGDKIGIGVRSAEPTPPQQHGPAEHQAGEDAEGYCEYRPKVGHPAGEARGCILNLDSPSYPPTLDEYRQCGCPDCLQKLTRINY
jgi:hypothetical protein